MQSICVFLGANPGALPDYTRAARDLGRELADRGLTCVYGGSDSGLMKVLADSALEAGGRVVGVTVQALRDREIFHRDLTELHVVGTMNERKSLMVGLSDGFVAMPGGIGTLEELFAVYTLNLLGFDRKPFGVLDVNGYYEPLAALLNHAEDQGFVKRGDRRLLLRSATPRGLLDQLLGGL